jgi:hypothetical protein
MLQPDGDTLPVVALTYGPLIPVTLLGGHLLQVTITDGVAFAFVNPTGALTPGALVLLRYINASGVAHGAGTFGTNYRVSAAVAAVATGFSRTIGFLWTGIVAPGAGLVEVFRTAADVPN